jgi:hypothetical protein
MSIEIILNIFLLEFSFAIVVNFSQKDTFLIFFCVFGYLLFDQKRYRSEIVSENDTPSWAPVDVGVAELGGFDTPFVIKCFNWDKSGDHFCILHFLIFLYISFCTFVCSIT